MRICFVGFEVVPSGEVFVGGLVNNVIRTAKGLTQRGHQVFIITSDVKGTLRKKGVKSPWYEILPVSVHGQYASFTFGLEFLIKAIFRTITEYANKGFDIIHIHSAYPMLGFLSAFSLLTNHLPVVFTLYSPIESTPLKDRKGMYPQLASPALSRFYFSKVDVVVGVSENVRKSLELVRFNKDKIEVIPPAVDDRFFDVDKSSTGIRKALELKDETPVILYCGNWAPWKGIDVLLESMTKVVNEFPEAKLITAWGELYNAYDERKILLSKKIKKLGLEKTIIEMGVIVNIEKLMAACDVFVSPFLNTDGVSDRPLVILEAMACGKAVIATKVGGIPEIIQNGVNGILVDPNDRTELEGAICMLLRNKALSNRIGMNAAYHISKNYSIDRITTKLEKVYEKLL